MIDFSGKNIGLALCGSFCTFEKAFEAARRLVELGANITPIMSFNAFALDTRFGSAEDNNAKLEEICGQKIIATITGAEPIGPKKMFDLLAVAPCTGNTLAKLALSIIDTPVTMAVKSHIRNARPVVLAVSTNDALAGAAKHIGALMNYRNFYFVPMCQDDFGAKPTSIVADYALIPETIECALNASQLQPVLFGQYKF